jgi:hypothetical protein
LFPQEATPPTPAGQKKLGGQGVGLLLHVGKT